jgi:hypothetical protein
MWQPMHFRRPLRTGFLEAATSSPLRLSAIFGRLAKWLLAVPLMCSSKKRISTYQFWRKLWGVDEVIGKPKGSYRTPNGRVEFGISFRRLL